MLFHRPFGGADDSDFVGSVEAMCTLVPQPGCPNFPDCKNGKFVTRVGVPVVSKLQFKAAVVAK
jgi:hypothetical protein